MKFSGKNSGIMVSIPVEIVEKGEEVESQLAPALLLTVGQDVGVHDGGGVVQSRPTHHWTGHIPAAQSQPIRTSAKKVYIGLQDELQTDYEGRKLLAKYSTFQVFSRGFDP